MTQKICRFFFLIRLKRFLIIGSFKVYMITNGIMAHFIQTIFRGERCNNLQVVYYRYNVGISKLEMYEHNLRGVFMGFPQSEVASCHVRLHFPIFQRILK